ncbi:hypothetical protein [Pontibacter saemangeumensis]
MSTKPKRLRSWLKYMGLELSTPLVAIAALGCAFLVETGQINYTYPLELVLQGLVNDSVILTISTK